jgi:hypothetical protein
MQEVSTPKPKGGRRPGAGRKPGIPNKLTADVKALASQYGAEAIRTLKHLMLNGEHEQVRFAAAKELLDRGYGKARQEIDLTRDNRVTVVVNRNGPLNDRPCVPVPQETPALVDHSGHYDQGTH